MPGETAKQRGSRTAKNGFKNEYFVIETFNDWKNDKLAQDWLKIMGYELNEIEYVHAEKVKGSFKADVQVQIKIDIKLKKLEDVQNISVKLVSNPSGFNQIDKRRIRNYKEIWDIPTDVEKLLKYFCGELKPYKKDSKNKKRMFINEFSKEEQQKILSFFKKNKMIIITDIMKGRGKFAAEWFLVILKIEGQPLKWVLKPMNEAMNFFGNGEVEISPRGSIKIGHITVQRKGGDAGKDTANMMQFKINPCEIL